VREDDVVRRERMSSSVDEQSLMKRNEEAFSQEWTRKGKRGRKEGSMVVNKRYAGAEHLRREIYEASMTSSSKPRREDEKQQGYGGKWDSICEGKREGGDV
jgi:hypothetical protein